MRRVVVAAAAVALVAATGVLARTLAAPDPQALAVADGCERSDTLLQTGRAPNWAYVYDSTTRPSDSPPEQRWASGIANANHLPWYSPHVSGGDTPYSHASYDVNLDVKLDAGQEDLIGLGNNATAGPESSEFGRLHVEREAGALPYFVWPEPGDRVRIRGYWVWDCDHYQPAGERTEIHPFTALWVDRRSSSISRTGEREADLFVSSDKTEAGQHADCAHKTKKDQEAFKQCVGAEPNYVDMGGTYKFVFALPTAPALPGKPTLRIVDAGSVNAPRIRYGTNGKGFGIAFVVPHDGKRHVIAKRFFAGWTLHKPRTQHLRVSVEKVVIRRSMDPGCLPQKSPPCGLVNSTHEDQVTKGKEGEWNFYWDVGGVWSLWRPLVWHVRDGQTIRPRVSADVWLPRGKSFRVLVWTRECDWGRLRLGGGEALWPCPTQPEVGVRSGDDVPGAMLGTFRGPGVQTLQPQWGVTTCPRTANPRGCYSVTVRVRRVG